MIVFCMFLIGAALVACGLAGAALVNELFCTQSPSDYAG